MDFKFEVGEYLQVAHESNPLGPDKQTVYQVIERNCQECPAGAQHWYTCRGHFKKRYEPRSVTTQLIKFNEIELADIPVMESSESSSSLKDQIMELMMKIDDEKLEGKPATKPEGR